MMWAAYVTHGMEFALVEDCTVLGVKAVAPRKVEAIRTGNRRWPEARVTPYLPNYVFVSATPEEWHWLREIRYVRDIMGVLPQLEPRVREFVGAVEAEFSARMDEIDRAITIMKNREASRGQRIEAMKSIQYYQQSDLLEVMTGPFAGMLAQFSRIAERGARGIPEIEATVMIFGRETNVSFDPLEVRKAV